MENNKENSTPFSMPQATLESIRKLIDVFSMANFGIFGEEHIPHENAQHLRREVCSQLRVVSSPLLSESANKKLKEELQKIIPPMKKQGHRDRASEILYAYSPVVDIQLNEFVILIQMELQKKNHFMPNTESSKQRP